jgi:hypothetical protein
MLAMAARYGCVVTGSILEADAPPFRDIPVEATCCNGGSG